LAATSRDTVEADRSKFGAMARSDMPRSIPIKISSGSAALSRPGAGVQGSLRLMTGQ